jgi:hypothetical protein
LFVLLASVLSVLLFVDCVCPFGHCIFCPVCRLLFVLLVRTNNNLQTEGQTIHRPIGQTTIYKQKDRQYTGQKNKQQSTNWIDNAMVCRLLFVLLVIVLSVLFVDYCFSFWSLYCLFCL